LLSENSLEKFTALINQSQKFFLFSISKKYTHDGWYVEEKNSANVLIFPLARTIFGGG
jgi:hypothetical protein